MKIKESNVTKFYGFLSIFLIIITFLFSLLAPLRVSAESMSFPITPNFTYDSKWFPQPFTFSDDDIAMFRGSTTEYLEDNYPNSDFIFRQDYYYIDYYDYDGRGDYYIFRIIGLFIYSTPDHEISFGSTYFPEDNRAYVTTVDGAPNNTLNSANGGSAVGLSYYYFKINGSRTNTDYYLDHVSFTGVGTAFDIDLNRTYIYSSKTINSTLNDLPVLLSSYPGEGEHDPDIPDPPVPPSFDDFIDWDGSAVNDNIDDLNGLDGLDDFLTNKPPISGSDAVGGGSTSSGSSSSGSSISGDGSISGSGSATSDDIGSLSDKIASYFNALRGWLSSFQDNLINYFNAQFASFKRIWLGLGNKILEKLDIIISYLIPQEEDFQEAVTDLFESDYFNLVNSSISLFSDFANWLLYYEPSGDVPYIHINGFTLGSYVQDDFDVYLDCGDSISDIRSIIGAFMVIGYLSCIIYLIVHVINGTTSVVKDDN